MIGDFVGPLPLAFAAFRLLVAAALGVLAWRLYRRPSARPAFAALLAVNLVAAVAYLAPLERPYGFGPGSDKAFNLGMVASTAAGNSPFEHTQVGFGSPEPAWNLLLAAMAGFEPTRAGLAYDALTLVALALAAVVLFAAGRRGAEGVGGDAWQGFWVAFAVLELGSLSMSAETPTPPFWTANFLLKPQHGLSLGLVGLVVLARHRLGPVAFGALLGGVAWSFLLVWAYVLPGLALAAFWERPRRAALARFAVSAGVSLAVAAPLILHLATAFPPTGDHGAATHMWQDVRGLPLAVPNWTTLDLGPLLTLGVAGAWVLRRRRGPVERTFLALLAAGWLSWAASIPAALLGVAPEPDELHYYVRFLTGWSAGIALAAATRWLDGVRGWPKGRAAALAIACLLPVSFHAYWDPPTMDRYYREGVRPIGPKKHAAAEWARAHTGPRAVFVAGADAASWLPALTGRRVLLNEAGALVPPDLDAREEVERVLLTSDDPRQLRLAAARYGVTHLAIDEALREKYPPDRFPRLAASPHHETVHLSSAVRLVVLSPDVAGGGPPD